MTRTNGGHHGDAAVLDLSRTPAGKFLGARLGREAKRIPVGQQRAGRTYEKMVIKREVKNVSKRLERTAAKTA